jgi:hypothetical protein
MRPAAVLALFLCGCAGLDAEGCGRANWYDVGHRDAIFGLQRQDEIYARQCQANGVSVNVTRYAEGFREGKYEADLRTSGSHD